MTPTDTDVPTAGNHPAWRRPRFLAAAAAVLLVVVVGGTVALTNDDSEPRNEVTAPTSPDTQGGPITPGGTSTGSCVEVYDLETLTNREVAFDGRVKAVEGDTVTFTVNEWYRGGDRAEVSLQGAQALSGLTSAGANVGLDPGTRLLVAGDGGFAWSCGFTQPYDAEVAADWAAELRG